MPGIEKEFFAFLVAIITGVSVRSCYQCLECFRAMVRHKLWMMEIEDFVFWIGSAIYVFVQIYYTSDGSIRWYFALGIVIGVVIATIILRKIKKMTKKIYDLHSAKSIAKKEKKRYYNKY